MHLACLCLQDVVQDADEALEESCSAVTVSGIQLQHAGLSETSEGDRAPSAWEKSVMQPVWPCVSITSALDASGGGLQ